MMHPTRPFRHASAIALVLLAGCDSTVRAIDAAPMDAADGALPAPDVAPLDVPRTDSAAMDVGPNGCVSAGGQCVAGMRGGGPVPGFTLQCPAGTALYDGRTTFSGPGTDLISGPVNGGCPSTALPGGEAAVYGCCLPIRADAGSADVSGDAPPSALPIAAPAGAWTWVPLEGAVCDDGTPTGVGVNLVPGAPGVLVFFNGGGICWDYQTCAVLNTSVHGPYGDAQFATTSPQFVGSILDRTTPANPFVSWSMVFVPNCTGDAFVGERDTTYTSGGATRVIHHRGRTNALALLRRLAVTAEPAGRVALVGVSTGGIGATMLHETFRGAFPRASGFYVLSDSAPLLRGDSMPAAMRNAWYDSWGLGWLDPLCSACRGDLFQLYGQLAVRYRNDRTALLTTLQDRVMSAYYGADAATYELAVRAVVDGFNTLPQRHAFLAAGNSHALLGRMSADGAALYPWLTQWITDVTSWTSRSP